MLMLACAFLGSGTGACVDIYDLSLCPENQEEGEIPPCLPPFDGGLKEDADADAAEDAPADAPADPPADAPEDAPTD